jgi:hypothetical protein
MAAPGDRDRRVRLQADGYAKNAIARARTRRQETSSIFEQETSADVGLLDWLGRGAPREDPRLREWKREWVAAALTLEAAATRRLRNLLDGFGLTEDEIEIEREMLDALDDAAALAADLRGTGLPVVETGHRVVGHDRCHFTAAASMPDEPGQPTGRLFITSARAIFVGGPSAVSSPWHMIGEARHDARDVVLVRATRDRVYRFQCNSFSETLRAVLIARELIRKRPGPAAVRL